MLDLPTLFADQLCKDSGVPREPDGFVGASQMHSRSETCFKKHQMDIIRAPRIPREYPLPIAIALMRGTVLHQVITDLSKNLPVVSENNVRMVDEAHMLSGSADFIMWDAEKRSYVVELKSMRPDQYRFLTKPVSRHIYQVHVYMMLSGVRDAIIHYIPHANEPDDDLLALLKRAQKKAAGLGGDLSNFQQRIATLIADMGDWKAGRRTEPVALGKQFVVPYSEEIAEEIRGIMREVLDGVERRVWLEKNLDNCMLCPYATPCLTGVSFNECDQRSPTE